MFKRYKKILIALLIAIPTSCILCEINLRDNKMKYDAKEVSYKNETTGNIIAGTLTLPHAQGPFPVVLLIAGQGPTDRDGKAYGTLKSLFVLAEHLTSKGIAVLRVDKRGVGKSTGKFDNTVTCQDFADDVLAGIAFLKTCKEIDPKQIGLIGHSEGGLVATLVTPESRDVAFVVLMSGAIKNDIEGTIAQVATQLQFDLTPAEIIDRDSVIRKHVLEIIKFQTNPQEAEKQLHKALADYFATLSEGQKKELENFSWTISAKNADGYVAFMNNAYYRSFIGDDAMIKLAQIHVPLLAIYGELDFMKPNITFIHKAMEQAKNKDYTIVELPKLNHALQTCQTGAIIEYHTIQETIAPIALDAISDWILTRIKLMN